MKKVLALSEFLPSGMVSGATDTVFFKHYLRHNPIEGPKQAAGRDRKSLPPCPTARC